MFYRSPDHIYRVREWDGLPWLVHGFGTRHSDIPGRFAQLATLKQVHSAECVAAGGRCGVLGTGDALLEDRPGNVLAVRTADCVPILLVDERLRAVAAVHAGWRGTAAHIVEHAVAAMRERFGSEAGDLHAAVGPAIGPCCYEVGPEVREQFGARGRGAVDLAAENVLQLEHCGVTRTRIHASNLCTRCQGEEFHSFRRERDAAGRQHSYVGVE